MTRVLQSSNKDVITKRSRLKSIRDLRGHGLLPVCVDEQEEQALAQIEKRYDIGITPHIYDIIKNVDDAREHPVGRQYIPSCEEINVMPDEEMDPIGDNVYSPVNGIVHRYPDRVLFKITNLCAVNCRYCFRRELNAQGDKSLSKDDFAAAIDYIKAHKEICEVILSGGDPLILSHRRMKNIIESLCEIDHVLVVRVHTRIPIADPDRIDNTLLSVFKDADKAIQVVVHVNHVEEITKNVERTLADIRASNCSVFSQSVLLKGVNDSVEALESLFRKLNSMHVKPYYLHHMDHARGTSHFRVPLKRGIELMKSLQGRISGTCLPKYMLDIPGGHGKIPINKTYVRHLGDAVYEVEDYQGCTHLYFDL